GHLDVSTEGTHAGAPDARPREVANAASLLRDGRIVGTYHKVVLPNYGVFDEDRNFAPGTDPARVWEIGGTTAGISVCEDIWLPDGPPADQAAAGARVLLNINGSPYHRAKATAREAMVAERARAVRVPVVYVSLGGGQDGLVCGGAAVVIDAGGHLAHRRPQPEEHVLASARETGTTAPRPQPGDEVHTALVVGVRDYVR